MQVTGDAAERGRQRDASLVAQAGRGDADAFASLMAPRLDRLLRSAQAILGNEADARDATQDTCLSAWVKLPRLRDEDRFDAWLSRVLVNRCRDMLRSRSRSREIVLDRLQVADGRPAPDTAATSGVMAAIDRLKVADRHILVLHHLHDQPLREIARQLGIPEGTAKSRLHAARRALERALEAQA